MNSCKYESPTAFMTDVRQILELAAEVLLDDGPDPDQNALRRTALTMQLLAKQIEIWCFSTELRSKAA